MATKCPKCQADNPETQRFCGECGTKLDLAEKISISKTMTLETPGEELARGTVFAGRYEIIEELGRGGMGKIYRAYDKKIEGEVALKLIRPEIAVESKTIDRFRNELKIAREIGHRNVCRMHELHQDGKQLFITMEYVSGQDLKGLVRETGALTTGKAISIAKQVAEGLAEAHDLGVIHRDLKPQNIMVDKEGLAKIMDFGIARSLRTAGMTAEGMIIGTPEYMAPEQVEGLEADQRTDIYALGAILFEMVTGRVPFEGDTPLSVAYKHKNEIPISPRKLNTQLDELSRAIADGLGTSKEDIEQAQFHAAGISTASPEAYRLFLIGTERAENLDSEKAAEYLEKAAQVDPGFAKAYLSLGTTYLAAQKYSSARETFRKAMEVTSRASEIDRLRIEAQYARWVEDDRKKNLMVHEEIAKKYPDDKWSHLDLGFDLWAQGKSAEAVAAFEESLRLDPAFGSAWNLLGFACLNLG